MKHKNLLKIIFAFFLISNISYGQLVTTIDFETEDDGYTASDKSGTTFTDVFNRISANFGGNSSFVWAIEDFGGSTNTETIDLDQIDVSGSSSFTFSIDMLAHHYQDWDSTDELLITYSLDGGGYQNLMSVQMHEGTGDSSNGPAALDLAFDGDGDCGASTTLPALTTGTQHGCTVSSSDFATFVTGDIALTSNSTLDIRLTFNNMTATDEGLYLDNIVITETSGSSAPAVSFDSATSSETETDATFATSGIPISLTNYDADVTITATVNGSSTAESGDYTLDLTPLTFDANETLVLPLSINDDADFDDETIVIDFTVTSGTADLGTSTHTVTITDDDTPPSIGFDTTTSSETETDATFTSANIPITVSDYSGEQIDVEVAITGGTAEVSDYTYTTQSLSFTANETQNITIDINDDADSDDETIILTITETSSVTGLVISEATHTITITDNEGPSSIYSEDFTGQNDKGAVGPTPTIDVSGVDWSVDVSNADLSANTDWFQVVNEVFEARDLDGDAIWLSPSIDISSYTNVQFSLSAVESGGMESGDIFVTEYRINGGTWTEATTNGSLNDDFTSATVSQTGLNGNTLEIRVTMNNGAGTEFHRLDDIIVEGTPASSDPTVTFDAVSSSQTETDATFATAGIPITLTNYDANVTITATINESSTAEAGDYTIDLTPLVFDANETLNIPLSIKSDVDFQDETIVIDIAVTNGTADITTSQHTVTITDNDLPQLFISEIMYDSRSVYGSDDEWIELYNGSGSDIDISNYTLEYNSITFTFPSSTTFTNNTYIVVAVGSNGDGTFNNDNPFTPDFNNLSVSNAAVATTDDSNNLTNTSRSIELKNTGGATIDIVTYSEADGADSNGSTFELIDNSADNSATSSNWQESGIFGGSPKALGSSIWTGAVSSDWSVAGNWNAFGVPSTNSNFVIPSGLTNYPIASSSVTVNNGLIKSGATLIAQSTFTGTVTYERTLGTTNWYLISSPVSGETYNSEWVAVSNIDDTNGTGSNIGIASYTTATNSWSYVQEESSGTFSNGAGYSIKQNFAGDIYFTGAINTANVSVNVLDDGSGFNVVGNPFTANLTSASFLTDNTANLVSQTLWVWNQATGVYDTYVTGDNFVLAPTQGFFIQANADTSLTFNESYQTATSGTFQKSEKTEIKLWMTDGKKQRYSRINYAPNATTSFDNGYDGEIFGGVYRGEENSFDVFTNLVGNNTGKKYQVQTLPNSNFENMIIPIGITADADQKITFTAETLNLPTGGIKVFLEDRTTNTFTRLDEAKSHYKVTLDKKLDGIGRFYLHTKSSALSTAEVSLENVSIYKTDASTLRITGLSKGKTSIQVFNILGKKVLNTTFDALHGVKEINLPKLASGIYIVQLATETGKLNKKITLK